MANYVNGLPTSDNSIDAFAMMSFRNNMPGTIGIAFVETTCRLEKYVRTSINEYTLTQLLTAIVSTTQKCH